MARKIDILITVYNESFGTVKPLLDSIAAQRSIDFADVAAIIVNDGGTVRFDDHILATYPFEIEYYYDEPHRGVSGARNRCLDLAKADYVMFCDCDDCFFNVNALWMLMREMTIGEFDTLVSVFWEENHNPENDEVIYYPHEQDSTFVHGKVHRRKYLLDNKIKFNESLKIHEDSYFNILAQSLAPQDRAKYCPIPFYLWCWNKDSVCRHDPAYILKTMPDMIKSTTALVKEFMKRGRMNEAQMYANMTIIDGYYTLNSDQWLDIGNKVYRDRVERNYSWFYNEFKFLIENCPVELRNQIVAGIKQRSTMQGVIFEKITFEDWMKHIKTLKAESPQSYNDEMGLGSITEEDKSSAKDALAAKEAEKGNGE